MIERSFSIYNLEFFLAILLRVAGVVYSGPIFSSRSVPSRVKLFLSVAVALLVTSVTEYTPLMYTTFYGFTFILIKELVTGLSIGLMGTMALAAINMAGQFIDREIGFSMASTMDQINGGQSTITADLYSYLVMLVMILSGLHYYILIALCDSFKVVPLGGAQFHGDDVYALVIRVLADYFIIALRISMPVFVAATLLNVVLGILAKASPQLSMFSIGMQLKVLVGLSVVMLTIAYLPTVTNYVYDYLKDFSNNFIKTLY